MFLASFWTPFHDLWWLVFGQTQAWLLNFLYHHLQSVAALDSIGAYGLAIIVLTILLRLLLAPLQQWQQHLQRKTQAEQRIIAPRLAELRRLHKGDPKGFNAAMMALYREHGINPFAGLAAVLPLLIQLPILIALFWVFRDFANSATVAAHFLFVPNLNDHPTAHLLAPYVPTPAYIALPLLAAITTYLQARFSLDRPAADAATLERTTHRTQQIVGFVVPIIVYFVAITVPAGLGLYWFVSNCLAILQQVIFKPKSSSTKV